MCTSVTSSWIAWSGNLQHPNSFIFCVFVAKRRCLLRFCTTAHSNVINCKEVFNTRANEYLNTVSSSCTDYTGTPVLLTKEEAFCIRAHSQDLESYRNKTWCDNCAAGRYVLSYWPANRAYTGLVLNWTGQKLLQKRFIIPISVRVSEGDAAQPTTKLLLHVNKPELRLKCNAM